jgi:hypothetical protein
MKTHALTAGAAILIGFVIAWALYRPKPAPPETAAPEVRHADGSLTLERKPQDAKMAPAIPKIDLPAGAKIEREVQVKIAPRTSGSLATTNSAGPGPSLLGRFDLSTGSSNPPSLKSPLNANILSPTSCPPLTVDLSLVRLKDQTHRVVASSPDGTIVGGVDIPIDAPKIPRPTRWSVSALAGYDSHVGRNVWGGEVGYQRGPFVIQGGAIGGTAFIGAGIKF